MITPAEIRQKAEQKYPAFLQALLHQEPFFPLELRFRKVQAGDDYMAVKAAVAALLGHSKARLGYGYSVEWQTRNTRQYGSQSYPQRILFENEADYVRFIDKMAEVAAFKRDALLIEQQFPVLAEWMAQKPHLVIEHAGVWPELLQVCRHFQTHPRPRCYIRELPIPVHTKFIEANQGILRPLLDLILPPEAIRPDETQFEKRFYLRYKEPLVRLRILDARLQKAYQMPVSDFSLPVSELATLDWAEGRFIVTENEMNFLTLPPLDRCLGLWGGGFKVNILQEVAWLAACPLLYWGDIDAQGFQILAQLRAYFPQARSVMMDQATLNRFQAFIVRGTPSPVIPLPHLNEAEQALYLHVAEHNLRLEQERIDQAYAVRRLRAQVSDYGGESQS